MQRLRMAVLMAVAPALVGLAGLGCSNTKNEGGGAGGDHKSGADNKGGGKSGQDVSTGAVSELASTGWGSLKGKVLFDGEPPPRKQLDITKDPERCLAEEAKKRGDTLDQTWKVGPNKGVADVVVWLRAPKDKYFAIPDDMKKIDKPVVLDQPYCAFEPHVFVVFPSYFDGKAQKKTGQELEIKNSATITHNTKYESRGGGTLNPGGNPMLPAGKEQRDTLKPSARNAAGGEQLINFSCSIHPWMRGYGWVFDHPYAAVTKGDRQDEMQNAGEYEIAKVPAGVEVELVYWHESMDAPKVFKKISLKEGDNTAPDIKIGK